MDKKVKMVSFWNYELDDLIQYLESSGYSPELVKHLKEMNKEYNNAVR